MARRMRHDREGAWHHVMNRGARRGLIFLDDGDRHYFITILSQLDARFGIEVHGYCLMGNHYHLLLRSRHPRLSEAMKWLGFRYARHFNWSHGTDGSPFRGRFHSVLIRGDDHLVAAGRYIHRNPLDLDIAKLTDYRWSSLRPYVGLGARPDWLFVDELLQRSGGRKRYGAVVLHENERSDLLVAHDGQLGPSQDRLAIDSDHVDPDLADLLARVQDAVHLVVSGTSLDQRQVTRLERTVMLVVAGDVMRCSNAPLAEFMGLSSPSSVRSALYRARFAVADPLASKVIEELALDDWSWPKAS